MPLTRYPVPFTVAAEMFRLLPPVFEMVNVFVTVVPRLVLPRFRLEGALR
jgi:hypothetical protein